jgi:hypothetical protein
MTKRKSPDQLQKEGRKSTFLKQYIPIAKRMAYLGATDRDLAAAFQTSIKCIWEWKAKHPEFGSALVVGKEEADQRMIRSMYQRGVGYDYDAVKIFMLAGAKSPIYAPYVEHVPPDPTAGMFWLKNRQPDKWRDVQQLEHVTGKYLISDKPLTPKQWIKERALVVDGDAVDVTPAEQPLLSQPLSKDNGKAKK